MHVKLEVLHQTPQAAPRPCPPLLFVHGAFTSARIWEKHFMPWFAARGYDVWAMSFRGHGASSGREFLSLASLEHYRYDLTLGVAHLPRTPILVGHGMGGLVIQQWLHEQRAPAVAMLGSVPPVSGMCSMLQLAMTAPRTLMELNQMHCGDDEAACRQQIKEVMFAPSTPDSVVDECLSYFQPESHRALIDLSVLSFTPLPPERRPPIMMIAGEQDALLPHHLVHAAAAHCGVSGYTLPNVGHALMLEPAWESVAQRLNTWIESLNFKAPSSAT